MKRYPLILVSLCLALSPRPTLGQDSTAENQPAPEVLAPAPDDAPIRKKLREIIIPIIDLQDTPLEVVIDFLHSQSIEFDKSAENGGDRGINIVLLEPGHDPKRIADLSRAAIIAITAKFSDIPLGEAINLIAQLSQCKVRIHNHAVALIPLKPGELPEIPADDPEMIARLRERLSSIILPSVEFADTPLRQALEFLTQKSAELDPRPAPNRGFNVILRVRPGSMPSAQPTFDPATSPAPDPAASPDQDIGDTRITLRLKQIPVLDALQYVAEIAGLEVIIGNSVVVVQPAAIETQEP